MRENVVKITNLSQTTHQMSNWPIPSPTSLRTSRTYIKSPLQNYFSRAQQQSETFSSFSQVTDMKEPWGTCVPRSVPITTCVNKCNMRHAENACGCRDVSPYPSAMQQKKATVTEGSAENNGLYSRVCLLYDTRQ